MNNPAHRTANTAASVRRLAIDGSWSAELLPRNSYLAAYTPESPIIGFAFESQAGIHAFASSRKSDFRATPNGLAYVPAGCDVYSSSDIGGEYLKITLPPARSHPWQCARRFSDAIDPIAIAAAHGLRRHLLLAGRGRDPLPCERCVQVLEERVAWITRGTIEAAPARSWMTPRRLKLVDALIEDRLDTKLTIEELAGVLGLSAGFFSRAFKAAVGKAPHDYIVDRRISRARMLLERTQLDCTTIAHGSGFASHAHMTATFRNRLGISPTALRKLIN
jgi:AraC family transcriptional regulator